MVVLKKRLQGLKLGFLRLSMNYEMKHNGHVTKPAFAVHSVLDCYHLLS